jgi:hypothetical protein
MNRDLGIVLVENIEILSLDREAALKAWEKRRRNAEEKKAGGAAPAAKPPKGVEAKPPKGQGLWPPVNPNRLNPENNPPKGAAAKAAAKAAAAAAPAGMAKAPWAHVPATYFPPAKKFDLPDGDSLNHYGVVAATEAKTISDQNCNETYHIKDPDGREYMFKPIEGERFHGVRADIVNDKAPLAEREVLAHRIDAALDLGMIPKTVMARVTYKDPNTGKVVTQVGSTQEWINARPFEHGAWQSAPAEEIAKLGVFDAIIGNLDRHGKNYLMTKDGHLKGIDHGFAFGQSPIRDPKEPGPRYDPWGRARRRGRNDRGGVKGLRSWAIANISEGAMTKEAQRALGQKIDAIKWDVVLKGSHLNVKEVTSLKQRAAFVSKHLHAGTVHDMNLYLKAQPY